MQPLRIERDLSRQDFQGDRAIQLRVMREVHFTHATFAKLRADFITAYFLFK